MSVVKRKITYRLYPTKKQEQALNHTLRLHQQLYNCALEQRINTYKNKKKYLNFYDQSKELTILRAEIEEYQNLNAQSSQVTLKRLDLAFQHFFRRLKEKQDKAGFPRFKSIDRYTGWGYKTYGDGWKVFDGEKNKHGYIRLSNIWHIKIRGKAKNIGKPKTCEIQHKQGKWYASITIECEVKKDYGKKAIGIDWGLTNFATIASHDNKIEEIENPRFLRKHLKKLKAKQRVLSRKKLGSNNIKIIFYICRKIKHQKHE
jgi:putative transposase